MTLDPEVKARLFPLPTEQLGLLEESLKREGCRDPLVLWNGILADGHHRHEICARLGVPFKTVELVGVASKEELLDWVDANQLGRRNLTPIQASLLRGRRYNFLKRKDGGHGNQKSGCQNDPPIATQLATQHGVSAATIKRDGKFAQAVEALVEHENYFAELRKRNPSKPRPPENNVAEDALVENNADAVFASVVEAASAVNPEAEAMLLDGRMDVSSFNDSHLKFVRKMGRMRRKDEREAPLRKRREAKGRADLEKDFVENLGQYQKEALQRLVSATGILLREEHQWAVRSLRDGNIALDGDDQEALDAVQYFLWMFEALAPWFKKHAHKRRVKGEKPKLTVV